MTWHPVNKNMWQLWDDTLVVGMAERQGSVWVGYAAGERQHYSVTLGGIQAKVEADCLDPPLLRQSA